MQLMLDPAFLLHGTPQEYLWWFLVLIAVVLLWITVEKGNGLTLAIHLIVIAALVYFAMGAHPAHAQFVERTHRVVLTPIPIPRPNPLRLRERCDGECTAIGKRSGCSEKRLCYDGITR